jgi:putative sterol carrier protein
MEATKRSLAADTGLKEATADVALTLEQVVTEAPTGTVRWHIVIDHGSIELVEGPAEAPGLRFTTDYATASAIASGSASAQWAFTAGRLRVGGDVSMLVTHQRTLASLDDALADVRAETTYDTG